MGHPKINHDNGLIKQGVNRNGRKFYKIYYGREEFVIRIIVRKLFKITCIIIDIFKYDRIYI